MKSTIDNVEIDEIENYLSYIRPPKEIREKLDISYRIEKQSVIIFEIRPNWQDVNIKMHIDMVKSTFVKKDNNWKVYWKRADLKWHLYKPNPIVPNLFDFIRLIEKDEYGCFLGIIRQHLTSHFRAHSNNKSHYVSK
ncbi:DUF3024 domain-containing protein [Flavobacterium sp. Arc2]|jgi:hypothetical protein|uniref:DUF3024 domain-containing protein n=1 Tax=Flavobacterium sp. Arc2 TaxID=3046685 RepID=UPI00352DAAEA